MGVFTSGGKSKYLMKNTKLKPGFMINWVETSS